MKKLSQINEGGFWKSGINRAKSGELRKEEGKKVQTTLGNYLILPYNSEVDYERVIQLLLDGCGRIKKTMRRSYSGKVQPTSEIHQDVVKDKRRCFSVERIDKMPPMSMCFPTYEELMNRSLLFQNLNLEEEDYYAILESIKELLEKRYISDGTISYPCLYYIGTYEREVANNFLSYMYSIEEFSECDINFMTTTTQHSLTHYDITFSVDYMGSVLYDKIMEVAKKYIEDNSL